MPTPFQLLKPLFIEYRFRILFGIIALLGVDFFQLLIPRVVRSTIDGLESGAISYPQLQSHAFTILGLALAVAICRFFWRYMVLGFSRIVEQDIRNTLFSHLLRMDMAFFQRRTTGELMALSTNDLASIQLFCGMGLIAFVDAIVMSLAAISFMVYINPKLTIIAILPLPMLAIITKLLSGHLHKHFGTVQKQFGQLTELARSAVTSIRLIKVYTREQEQVERFDQMGQQYINSNMRVAKIQGALFPISALVANLSLLLIMYFGGGMAIEGTISIGDFVAFISYLFMMTWPMMAIGWVANLFQRGMTSLARIHDVLKEQPILVSGTEKLSTISSPICLQNLSFTYPGQKNSVLNQINLTISKGIFGIVGPTGSGKTTLCHLLARLYPVNDKTIMINGQELNSFSLTSYRRCVAYSPQEPLLFSNSIAENISLGAPGCDSTQIEHVAKLAGIHDEITSLPQGYASRIGEKGVKLSGGQRQRIALARAFITDSPVLIIDDGLSAVDSVTEKHIIKALQDYAKKKIVIIVSHRLSPLLYADHIVVMEDGAITASGKHHELICANDFYRTIYENQKGPGAAL